MRWLFVILFAASCGVDRAHVLIGSHHIGYDGPIGEENFGVLLSKGNLSLGVYQNSYGDTSIAALTSSELLEVNGFGLHIFGGVAHYPNFTWGDESYSGIIPLAGIEARYETLFVQFLPAFSEDMNGLISFGLTFPIGD